MIAKARLAAESVGKSFGSRQVLKSASLWVYPLTPTETQLDFRGDYEPPFGPVGTAVNAVVGHRIAELCVHSFLVDVARHLRRALSSTEA